MDPKLGPARKTAGIRNLPKIERKQTNAGLNQVKLSSDLLEKTLSVLFSVFLIVS
jgi:hypothetical protein